MQAADLTTKECNLLWIYQNQRKFLSTYKISSSGLLQLMVVGQAGARGRLVVNPVEQVLTSVLGAARNLRPNMAAKRAMEIRGKVVSAT